MLRPIGFLLVAALLLPAMALAQLDVAGEWDVTFTGPQGPAEYTMYVTQEGTRLTGRLTSCIVLLRSRVCGHIQRVASIMTDVSPPSWMWSTTTIHYSRWD